MKDQENKHAVIVGAFVLGGLLLLVIAIFMIGDVRNTFKKKIEIVSVFDDVNGLADGNNIWFSGVKIGTVSKMAFYGKSQVAVGMKIDSKHRDYIRKDAKVRISADGLIGNKILVIFGGSTAAGAVEEGDTLVVEKTFSSEEILAMLQENNKNVLAITSDFKTISKKLVAGEGTVGKLLGETTLYDQLNATTASLKNTSSRAEVLVNSLVDFSTGLNNGLNKKGTLTNELTTDTTVFKSVKASALQLKQATENAEAMMANLKAVSSNPNTPLGVLTQDQTAGTQMKGILENLEGSSQKLEESMEALQHNFLLRGFFRKKAKKAEKAKQDSLGRK